MFSFSRKFFFSCKKKKNWIIAYTLHVHKSKDCEYFDLYRNTRSRGTHCQVQRYVYTRRPFAISCNYERVSFSSSTPIMRINEASFLRKSASTWPHIIVRSCVSCNTGRVFSFFFFLHAHIRKKRRRRGTYEWKLITNLLLLNSTTTVLLKPEIWLTCLRRVISFSLNTWCLLPVSFPMNPSYELYTKFFLSF